MAFRANGGINSRMYNGTGSHWDLGFEAIWNWFMLVLLICHHFITIIELTTCFHEFPEYKSTKVFYQILGNICFDFLKCSKLRKQCLFDQCEICFLFHLRNIGKKIVNSYSEKFVETCRELDLWPPFPEFSLFPFR